MVLNDIEALIEKYESGVSTLEEENTLRQYFEQSNVPSHLQHYKVIFSVYKNEKNVSSTKPIALQQLPKKNYYGWLAVAATIVIALGLFLNKKPTQEELGTFDNPELAFKAFQSSLQNLSVNYAKGTSKVDYLNAFNKVGTQVGYLNEIENTTRLIFKTKN